MHKAPLYMQNAPVLASSVNITRTIFAGLIPLGDSRNGTVARFGNLWGAITCGQNIDIKELSSHKSPSWFPKPGRNARRDHDGDAGFHLQRQRWTLQRLCGKRMPNLQDD